jgi:hypothetical protein
LLRRQVLERPFDAPENQPWVLRLLQTGRPVEKLALLG